jgi:hypothetical protein
VSFQREGLDCLLTIHNSEKLAHAWSLGPIPQVKQGYTAALAAYGKVRSVNYQSWLPTNFEK